MRTILVASSKGGVGKTTLATNLAAHYAVDGKRTVLVC
jgi:chromosome partitioning protein